MKRGKRYTAERIERGGGNGGDPVRSPPGSLEISPAGHGRLTDTEETPDGTVHSTVPPMRTSSRRELSVTAVLRPRL